MYVLHGLFNRNGVLRHAVGAGAGRLQDRRDRQRFDERCQATVGLAAVAAGEDAAGAFTHISTLIRAGSVSITAGADWLRAEVGFAGGARTLCIAATGTRANDSERATAGVRITAGLGVAGRREVHHQLRRAAALAAVEAAGGRGIDLVADHHPAVVAARVVDPALDVGDHGGVAVPHHGVGAADRRAAAGRTGTGLGVPGDATCRGLTLAAAADATALAPSTQAALIGCRSMVESALLPPRVMVSVRVTLLMIEPGGIWAPTSNRSNARRAKLLSVLPAKIESQAPELLSGKSPSATVLS